jgi:Domain of unknown function (DUF4440)
VFAVSSKPDDEKAVLAAEKQYANALVKADAATLEKLLADDLSYTHSSVKMETKADVIKGVTSGTSKYTAVEFKTTKVRQFGSTVITYHDMWFVHPDSVSKVFVTMVWAKQPAGWQLVQREATKLPD